MGVWQEINIGNHGGRVLVCVRMEDDDQDLSDAADLVSAIVDALNSSAITTSGHI